MPGNFFYITKDFRDTDIHHSDINNALVQIIKFFACSKLFLRICKIFYDETFATSKFFPQFVEKIEKLKLTLSKQTNKMLKIRSEMLKIRKNSKIIKLEKNSQENFPEIFRTPRIPRIFRILGFPGIFLKIVCFPGS